MPSFLRVSLFIGLLVSAASSPLAAQTLDSVIFGNAGSESAHGLTTGWGPVTPDSFVTAGTGVFPSEPSATSPSDAITGALGQSARRLLPRTPNPDVYGGETTFTLAVDPVGQNYCTLKLWGSDPSSGIWLILNVNGLEVGNRHGGQNLDELWFQNFGWYPNRFIYRTLPLPLSQTRGRTSVTLKIRSVGREFYYSTGAYFGDYQKMMNGASPALYRAYTHLGSILNPAGEAQGTEPALLTPRTVETEAATVTTIKANANSRLAGYLNATAASLTPAALRFMAECYDAKENLGQSWLAYPAGMTAATLVSKVVAGVDAQVATQSANSLYVGQQVNDSWGGYFGPMGDAIRLLWPQINAGTTMSTTVAYAGSYGTVTRTSGWSQGLRASLDWGRYNRRGIANQAIACDGNIYRTNRALLLVDPVNALNETEALRYVKEAAGLFVFRDKDQTGGGAVPVQGNFLHGPEWYMITSKGTTKDGNGFVGSDYGEMGPRLYELGLLSGDAALQARALQVTKARDVFRFPGPDEKGYLVMQGTEPIGERNNVLPGKYAYVGRTEQPDFVIASQGPGVVGNELIGYFQQQMNDGQLFRGWLDDEDYGPYGPMRYAAFKTFAATGIKLPMSVGQPDFAWADEENMVVAAKHGEERLFANLFWRQPDSINGLAKVFHLDGSSSRLADVQVEDVRFRSTGASLTLGNAVDSDGRYVPPDQPVNAANNEVQSIAWRSDLATIPSSNFDGGRGTGYTLRYGHWLVGINASYNANYTVLLPSNFTSATDLISGAVRSGPVALAPRTSAVFYLPDTVDTNPKPPRVLRVSAIAIPSPASVVINWSPAAAATSYQVKRATVSGGPYTTLASTVRSLYYVDSTADVATTYYYVVSGVNAGGEGGDSAEATATPAQSGLVNRARGGSASASGQNAPTESADKAFDGSGSRWSHNVNSVTGWLQYDFGNGITWAVTRYDVTSISIAPERDPKSWTFLGSNDGTNWTTLDTRTNQTFGRSQTRQFTISNTNGYRYYRFNITMVNGGIGNTIQLAELGLYASAAGTLPLILPPAGLTATTGSQRVLLSWTPVAGALTYNVKRSVAGGAYVTLGNTDQSWYLDSTAANGVAYAYVVTAVRGGSESTASSSVGATPIGAAIPAMPTGFTVTSGPGNGQITLSWSASPGATSYTVKRSTSSGGTYNPIAPGVADAAYIDSGLSTGVTWYYVVTAVNASGESAPSAVASGQPSTAYAWSAAPASAAWNVAGNWGGTVPGNGVTLVFNNSNIVALSNDLSGLVVGGLVFNFGASPFVIAGNALTLGGNLTNNASSTETINAAMTLNATRTLTVNDGNLVLGGGITDGSASYGLTKEGLGKLTLASANTFDGGLAINAGVVQVGTGATGSVNGGAFGTGTVTVHPDTTLQFLPNSTTSAFTFANNFVIDGGTIAGLDGQQHVGTTAKTIDVTGNGGALQTKWDGKDLYLDGKLTGVGSLLLQNLGGSTSTIRITNTANTFSGSILLDAASGKGQQLSIEANNALQNATVTVTGTANGGSGLLFTTTAPVLGGLSGDGTFAIPAGTNLSVGKKGSNTVYSGVITGAGALTKIGSGALTLTGASSFTGATTIASGRLDIAGPSHASAVTVASGATLGLVNDAPGVTSLAGMLTLSAGSSLAFELGSTSASDQLVVAGGYTGPSGGVVTINLTALSGFGTGNYTLITGAAGLNAGSFVVGSAPAGNSYTLTVSGTSLLLAVRVPGLSVWDAAPVSGTWSDPANWGGFPPISGDSVVFGASGITSLSNDITGLLLGGVTFGSGAGAYTLAGNATTLSGDILNNSSALQTINLNITLAATVTITTEPGDVLLGGIISDGTPSNGFGLIKQGAGSLTLSGANTFTGGIILNGGTLFLPTNKNGALGTGTLTLNAATLALTYNGGSTTVTFANPVNLNAGGELKTTIDGKFIFSGPLAVNDAATLRSLWDNKWLTLSGVVSGTGDLTLLRTVSAANQIGYVQLTNTGNTFTGSITTTGNASAGAEGLAIGASNALVSASIVNNAFGGTYGASKRYGLLFTTTSANLGSLAGSGDFILGQTSAHNPNVTTSSVAVALTVGGNGADTTYSGVIGGLGSLTKTGVGTMTLSAANTYSGLTTVSGGTLNLAGALAGGLKVNAGATFSPNTGTAATVNLAGPLTLASGATLAFELGAVSDRLALTGAYTAPVGGTVTLNIAALSGFGAGTYPLITGAAGISAASFAVGSTPVGYTCTVSASGGTLSLIVTSWTAIQGWRYDYFGTIANTGNAADAADPDGDGRSNLLEYATGTSPLAPDTRSVTTPGLTVDGAKLTLTFDRIADPLLTYTVEATDDLMTWSETVWTSTGPSNTAGTITAVDPEPISAHARRFLRLRITP